ncbi:MAG: T9SS type A sorting domain-containing protein [Saprospiraceae bacterium]|nr:T9SS type A sorting domain-containing protein [Saprospiraceae bacterium]
MRIFFLLFAVFGGVTTTYAQPGFNKVFHEYASERFSFLTVDKEKVYCVGTAYDTTINPSPLQIHLVKLDTNGNILLSKLYKDSLNGYLSTDYSSGSILKTTKSNFLFAPAVFGRASLQLLQFNENLDIVSIFEYPLDNNFAEFYDQIVEMPDGGFMIAGAAQRPNYKQDGFIRRVDRFGNVLYFKYYGKYNKDENFRCLLKIDNNRYLAGGSAGPDLSNIYDIHAGLWVIDSNGLVTKTWIATQYPDLLTIMGLLPASGGGFMAHGRRLLGVDAQGSSKVQCCILKFDSTLQLQWIKNIGPYGSDNLGYVGIYDMLQTPDGNYLLAGQRRPYDSPPTGNSDDWGGWLYKFSPEGDSIWARADNAPAGLKPTGSFIYGGVGVLSSGSVVAGGPGDIDDLFHGWVVKVSADGCLDSALCLATAVHTPEEDKALQIAPNPANEQVNITFPACAQEHVRLCLYNALGVLVQEIAIPEGETSHTLALQHLPPGWYMVCWVVDTRVRARARLVYVGR